MKVLQRVEARWRDGDIRAFDIAKGVFWILVGLSLMGIAVAYNVWAFDKLGGIDGFRNLFFEFFDPESPRQMGRALFCANKKNVSDCINDRIATANEVAALISFFSALLLLTTLYFSVTSAASVRKKDHNEIRAYVSVKTQPMQYLPVGSETFATTLILSNDGMTPAHDVHCRYEVSVEDYDVALRTLRKNRYEHKACEPRALASKEPTEITISVPVANFDVSILTGEDSRLRLFIAGSVYYDDVFGKEQKTEFVLRPKPSAVPFWEVIRLRHSLS